MTLVKIIYKLDPRKIYVSMQAYDASPEAAEQLFRGCVSIDDFSAKTDTAFRDAPNELVRTIIGCAHNFAAIKAYFESGDDSTAESVIGHLTKHDPPIALSADFLEFAGQDFFTLCQRHGKLLVPKYLDDVVFKTYAPSSTDLSAEFYKLDGIGVVTQVDDNEYHCSVGSMVKRTSVNAGQHFRMLVNGVFVYEERFIVRGSADFRDSVMGKNFERFGASNIGVIQTTDQAISQYILFRYLVKRFGIVLNITECPDLGTRKEYTRK